MSPATGLELDFGFGSLLDSSGAIASTSNGNNSSSALADFSSGTGAADYLSLSNLFDHGNVSASATGAAPAPSWQQTKKTLMEQQLQQEQNSLNALLSQHPSAVGATTTTATAATPSSNTPNPFGFATREELETLAASASNFSYGTQQQQQSQQIAAVQAQAQAGASSTSTNGSNNYMFVATIVDPTQEDATPQQMLFLPGSNQVIPMPAGTTVAGAAATASTNSAVSSVTANSSLSPMMALANLPVVFPQSAGAASTGTTTSSASNLNTTNWFGLQQLQQQQQQQQQQLLGSLSNGTFPTGLSTLEESYNQATAAAAGAPLDLSSLGLVSSDQVSVHQQQQHQLHQSFAAAAAAANKQEVPTMAHSATAAAAPAPKAAMPVRPLSAYNFFFSDERERILQNKTDETDVFDNAKKQRLLLAHLAKDRSKRRPHRKTHGKINFTTLSKLIGSRWKQLPDERKNFYREVAAIDLERYQRELRERSPQQNNGAGGGADFCT